MVKSERRIRKGCPSTVRHANQNTNSKEKSRHDNYLGPSPNISRMGLFHLLSHNKSHKTHRNFLKHQPTKTVARNRLQGSASLHPYQFPSLPSSCDRKSSHVRQPRAPIRPKHAQRMSNDFHMIDILMHPLRRSFAILNRGIFAPGQAALGGPTFDPDFQRGAFPSTLSKI